MNNSARLFRPASLPRTGNGASDLVAELVIKSCFSPSAFMEAAQLPVIRFLELFYENHNRDLQNFLRAQLNKNSYNLVWETSELMFLLSTRAGPPWPLHQRATWSTRRWKRSPSTKDPFHENQNCIANNESNGLDIATALLLEFKNNTLASWWTWSVGATTKRPSFTKTALKKSRSAPKRTPRRQHLHLCATNYWPSTTRTWPLR